MARAKTARCACCGQRSNLRKLACPFCPATAYASRAQIREGLHPCRCGHGRLEPVCLEDRARCFPDDAYGRDAWGELAFRFPGTVDPTLSRRAKMAAQTRKAREAYAAVRDPTDAIPF